MVLVVIGIAWVASAALHTFYYHEVEAELENEALISQTRMLEKAYGWDGNFAAYVRTLVENFDDAQEIELTALDETGKVLLPPNGVTFETPTMHDFTEA